MQFLGHYDTWSALASVMMPGQEERVIHRAEGNRSRYQSYIPEIDLADYYSRHAIKFSDLISPKTDDWLIVVEVFEQQWIVK